MAGTTRRNKPLKAASAIGDITEISISNVADGDLLVFNDGTSLWENGKALTGNYTLVGDFAPSTLTTSGDITAGDDLVVTTDLSVGGNSALTGNLTVAGTGTFDTTLTVTGAATLSSTLNLAGALTAAGFSFSGNGTVAGTLGVTGVLTATGGITVTDFSPSGNVSVGGTLSVTGLTTLDSDLTVNANISAGAVAGTSLSSGGDVSLAGDLLGSGYTLSKSGANVTMEITNNGGTLTLQGRDTATPGATSTLLTLDPDGAMVGYYDNEDVLRTHAGGIDIADQTAESDPFIGFYDADFGTRGAFIQAHGTAATGLRLRNEVQDGVVKLEANITGPATRTMLTADPNGPVTLQFDGSDRFNTDSNGFSVEGATNTIITMTDGDAEVGTLRKAAAGPVRLRNHEHGSEVYLEAEDAGGTLRAGAVRAGTASSATAVAFHNTAPIIQQTTTSQTPATFTANTSGIADDTATWGGYTVGDIVAILQAYGLIA